MSAAPPDLIGEQIINMRRQLDEARAEARRLRALLEQALDEKTDKELLAAEIRGALLTGTPAAPAPNPPQPPLPQGVETGDIGVCDKCGETGPLVKLGGPPEWFGFCARCWNEPSAPQAPATGLADVIRGALFRVLGIGRDEEIALATKTIVADIEYRKPAIGLDPGTVEACAKLAEKTAREWGEVDVNGLRVSGALSVAEKIRALASSREGVK